MLSEYAELSVAFPWLFSSFAFVFGAIVGSFLNVVIYRVPAGKSIVRPGSHCACGKPIAWYDNIPILSWFLLRGKARCCGRPYSFRYPFVELLTGLLFLWCWSRFGVETPGKALCGMLFISTLVCATFIDLDHMIIPDVFTIWTGVAGVILSVLVPQLHGRVHEFQMIASVQAGADALQGLFIGSGLVLWIALLAEEILKKEAMGFGDVKFVGAIGAFCGWKGAVFSVFGGAVVGTVWFVIALLWQKLSHRDKPAAETHGTETAAGGTGGESPASDQPVKLGFGVEVPFGPMLAIAGLLYFLFFDRWVAAYFAELQAVM